MADENPASTFPAIALSFGELQSAAARAQFKVFDMAQVVAGFGVPHTPIFPSLAARKGPDCEEAQLYREIEGHLDAARPDVILIFSNEDKLQIWRGTMDH